MTKGLIPPKKKFTDQQEEAYQLNMNKVMTDLRTLIERSSPLGKVSISHKGIILTVQVDLDKATKK